jgi:nucleotide-binding universal stress UspA family protein
MTTLDASVQVNLNNILLATDFSVSSDTALLYTLSLARRYGSKMYLVHVVPPGTSQQGLNDAWREAHTEITNQLIAGRLGGVQHQVIVTPGDVWEVLQRLINEHSINLLVVGTRGRTGVWKLLMGSIAETIFRQAPCPVLTVGPRTSPPAIETGPVRILFSTGFARHSLNAGGLAIALARQQGSKLGMMTVVREYVPVPAERARMAEAYRQRLLELVPPDAGLPQEPDVFVEFGTAAEGILKVASEWLPQLIVLGIRQPEGFARRVRWATAYEVVCKAPCPVLTLRMHTE